jgi:peptidoglycan hydrolase CwlO-like protein
LSQLEPPRRAGEANAILRLIMSDAFWATFIAGLFGTLVAAIATIFAALINRKPSLAAVIDARIRVLIETYEKTIAELRSEVGKLESKIDVYERTIWELRDHIGKLEAKIDGLNNGMKEVGAPILSAM